MQQNQHSDALLRMLAHENKISISIRYPEIAPIGVINDVPALAKESSDPVRAGPAIRGIAQGLELKNARFVHGCRFPQAQVIIVPVWDSFWKEFPPLLRRNPLHPSLEDYDEPLGVPMDDAHTTCGDFYGLLI
jgi:hypothetical protein